MAYQRQSLAKIVPEVNAHRTREAGRSAKAKPGKKRVKGKLDRLILDHRENGRKLARSMLRKWRVRMPAEEVDSVVDLALCEAAIRYSSEHGASFMTFFFYHLRGHLVRCVARAAQANSVFIALAQSAGVDTSEWISAFDDSRYLSVPENLAADHRDAETPENALIKRERVNLCREACDKLDELERQVIERSFADEQPLVDIARSLGYSRCHISRVKRSALERLKGLLGLPEEKTGSATRIFTITCVAPRTSVGKRASGKRRNRRRTEIKKPASARLRAA